MDAGDIEKRFAYHPPKSDQADRYVDIRTLARDFAQQVDAMCPDSREKSLAITHIEEAVFWANAAIARNE